MDAWDEFLRWATPSALLESDGTIRSLNAPMAATLGRPANQCVGHDFIGLLPETQRASAESLLIHGATTKTVAMRVLEFSGPGEASVISLIEARPVKDPASRSPGSSPGIQAALREASCRGPGPSLNRPSRRGG